MSEPAPRNAILASPSLSRDRLNAILEDAGLGRPLGPPERTTPAVTVLPVSGDLEQVVAVLRPVVPEGDAIDALHEYGVDTVDPDGKTKLNPPPTESLSAFGLKTGHGTVTWTPIEQYEAPRRPRWQPPPGPPVVVVLDSGVREHKWLPRTSNPPFCSFPIPDPSTDLPVPDLAPENGKFGAYWGHATFLAGLIRMTAPDAQVVSLRLMGNDGKLDSGHVVTALQWLHDKYIDPQHRVDVVLMAFGRPKKRGESNPVMLQYWINALDSMGVQFVASAGNNNSKRKTFPACLENVVSVGAGTSEKDREHYSNYGRWVRQWCPGTHVSLMPLTRPGPGAEKGNGFAVWSGTSFSAAIVAGELAQARAAKPVVGGGS
jgi:subtilisin family serine protease